MIRKTTEARVFTMACDLLLGESRKNVAAKFGITEKHLSRLLCTQEARTILVDLKHQIADAVIKARVCELMNNSNSATDTLDIIRKISSLNMRKNEDKIPIK